MYCKYYQLLYVNDTIYYIIQKKLLGLNNFIKLAGGSFS